MKPASALDYRALAQRRLPPFLFEYIDGGSYGEVTLERNVRELERVALRQRVLNDVSSLDLSTTLFGARHRLPLGLGPVGLAGLNARRGEVQAARAAAAAGVPFCLSTVSACPIAEVRAGTTAPFWFQLYMIRDRPFMRDLLARAREAGCPVLVFTVDLPMPGARYRDIRSGLTGSPGWPGKLKRFAQAVRHPNWAYNVGLNGRPIQLGNIAPVLGRDSGIEDFNGWMRDNFDPTVTWRDLDFVRAEWSGPLVIKGILDPEDAREARRVGADGIVVSNHGGRQLDGVLSTARALPPIADAVGGELAVLADGGVRSGLDVVRLLALGARFVLLGRAWAWALGGGGERGVAHVLRLMRDEMRIAMALTGRLDVASLDRSALADTGLSPP